MFSTFFITTPVAATVMAAIVGIPWALSLWAPFALISTEIAQREELTRRRHRPVGQHQNASEGSEIDGSKQDGDGEDVADQAGIILGLHNVAVSTPQILATLVSSVVFKMLQKPRNVPGDNSLGWVLRIGGVSALIATFFTSRLGEASDE
jgi:solute carrier family 45 protein 1/2/4